MPTAHNSAQEYDFAKTVLMPGDPLRAKLVAEKFLTDAHLVNNIRNVQGYTGMWKGVPVSVMGSGMGIPSIGIYSYELYQSYHVENILRIGSAGGMCREMPLRSVVFAMGASTNSNYLHNFNLPGTLAPLADYHLLRTGIDIAEERKARYYVGNVLSSDVFYNIDPTVNDRWARMGILAVEMETAALYANAAYCGKRALSLFTISDNVMTGEELTGIQRQNDFAEMIEIALDIAAKIEQ